MNLAFSNAVDFNSIDSQTKPTLFFKHSTRCSISAMALDRLSRDLEAISQHADIKIIDVINNRETSNAIADRYQIQHESPQAILIKGGKAHYSASHNSISSQTILESIDS